MTGYGHGSTNGESFTVSVDLKAVNNKFLDIHLRAGAELASVETLIRRCLTEQLSRGRVDVSLALERTDEVSYDLNRPLINGIIQALRTMQQEFKLAGEPDINMLARLPGVMQPARTTNGASLSTEVIRGIEQALAAALIELDAMRSREGQALVTEMEARLSEIERHLPIIEAAAGEQIDTYRLRLRKRISDLLAQDNLESIAVDQGRLAQEIAYLADRSDITEELARLRSHLTQFRTSINSQGEIGKRLDFLLQELNREINTTLSKATDLRIKDAALVIKAEIEKLREQVQNVE